METEGMDIRVGRAVARERDRRGRTQHDLGELMRAHGFKWSQATVWAVEKGERPLRFTEAIALQSIFDVPLEQFVYTGDEAVVNRAREDVEQRRYAWQQATITYFLLRENLRLALDRAEDLSDPVREIANDELVQPGRWVLRATTPTITAAAQEHFGIENVEPEAVANVKAALRELETAFDRIFKTWEHRDG